ncbi:MAG: hypothetical protein WC908_01530 [Candidatus Paceibacterota bacterium]
MKKYFLSLLIIFSIFFSLPVYAEVSAVSGFIPGQIWYSKDKLIEGDTVNIHTAVWNGESNSLSVKVEFYDKNVVLGDRDVVLNALELKDVYIPWKVTSGDHVLSAKIISSAVTVSSKKEKVILTRIATSNDKQFVSVVVKNNLGESVSETDLLKNQINKTSAEINGIIPEKVSTSISDGFTVLDNFRDKTFTQVTAVKDETQKEINLIKSEEKTVAKTLDEKSNIEDAVKKPIAYIKLFLFTFLSFIFGNKIVFYGILVIVVFFILRFIYRKIRNR